MSGQHTSIGPLDVLSLQKQSIAPKSALTCYACYICCLLWLTTVSWHDLSLVHPERIQAFKYTLLAFILAPQSLFFRHSTTAGVFATLT